MAANELARGHDWGGDFTQEEFDGGLENVVTGLKRQLEWEDEDEDEEEIEGGKKQEAPEARDAMPLEQILKFMMTGSEPRT